MIIHEDLPHQTMSEETFPFQRILIIEKERQNASWLAESLKSKGYDVWVVTHYEDGLNILDMQEFLGVLLSLDGTTGENTIQALDAVGVIRNRHPSTSLFVMSEKTHSEMIRESFARGVTGFLTKPILYDHMPEILFPLAKQVVGARNT